MHPLTPCPRHLKRVFELAKEDTILESYTDLISSKLYDLYFGGKITKAELNQGRSFIASTLGTVNLDAYVCGLTGEFSTIKEINQLRQTWLNYLTK